MHRHAARDEGLIFNLDVSRQQRATGDHRPVPHAAIVRDVTRRHDVVLVADLRRRFRRRAARDGVVLADLVAVADPQVAALAGESLVERIGAQNGARGDPVAFAQGGPALNVHVGFEDALRAHRDVALDYAEVPDAASRPNGRAGMDAGGGRHHGARIDRHETV